jgi:hypothetical protein
MAEKSSSRVEQKPAGANADNRLANRKRLPKSGLIPAVLVRSNTELTVRKRHGCRGLLIFSHHQMILKQKVLCHCRELHQYH